MTLSAFEHFVDAFEAGNHFLPQRGENDVVADSALNTDCSTAHWSKEVMYGLVVDLEVRASEEIFSGFRALDMTEDILHRAWDDTRLVVVSGKCVCLARGGLAISEDDCVVALHSGGNMGLCNSRVDGFVGRAGEDGVKVKFGALVVFRMGWVEGDGMVVAGCVPRGGFVAWTNT